MGATKVEKNRDFLRGIADCQGRKKDVEIGGEFKNFRVVSDFKQVSSSNENGLIDFNRHF